MYSSGCFDKSLKSINNGTEVSFILGDQHRGDPLSTLAVTKPQWEPGALRYTSQREGLWAEVYLPNTTAGRDMATLVDLDVIAKCSVRHCHQSS